MAILRLMHAARRKLTSHPANTALPKKPLHRDNDSFVLNAGHVIRFSLSYKRFSVEAE